MKNVHLTILYLITGYAIPLCLQLDKLFHYKTAFLMLACIVMLSFANPEIKLAESKENASSDKYTLTLIFLMGYIALVAPVIEWGYFKTDTGWNFWVAAGVFLTMLGLLLRIYAIHVLGRHFTGVVRQVEGHHLVKFGPYSHIRHPSYTGSIITFVGCAVVLEAWNGLIISTISMLIAYYLRIRAEEKLLLKIFGGQYQEYQQKTWKMIPFVW